MNTAAENLKARLLALPAHDRAELARVLLDSLEGEARADLEAAWDAELERRAEQIRTGQVQSEPAERVFSELREKYT